MESFNHEKEKNNNLYKDCAKAAKIYEIILDNVNFDSIEVSQVETDELNNMNSAQSLEYIKTVSNKKDETEGKINGFTKAIKNVVSVLINNIEEETDILDNLTKLSGYYYLFKMEKASDKYEEDSYMTEIDEVVNHILNNYENYYKILMLFGHFNKEMLEGDSKGKIEAYLKILFFLDQKMFLNMLSDFIDNKKTLYQQYQIPFPLISFKDKNIDAKMKNIYNLLYILQVSEKFKTNERFEYFKAFRFEYGLLDDINYILTKQNKPPLISLDKVTDDLADEAFDFSLAKTEKIQKDDEFISKLLEKVSNGKKMQEEFAIEKLRLEGKYNKLSKELNESKERYNRMETNYKNYLKDLESDIYKYRATIVEANTINNKQKSEIQSLKDKLKEREDIIERISYREIGSKIIRFFSLVQSKEEIEQNKKKNISSTNIDVIMKYIKKERANYYGFMKSNHTDLKFVLTQIKEEKNNYNILVHDKEKTLEKYIQLMNERDNRLGQQINFIFNNSDLINDYVFKKNNTIGEKEIYDEFIKKNNELENKAKDS